MKKSFFVFGSLLGLFVFTVLGLGAVFKFWLPRASPPSTEKVEATPERLARGEYLVEHVTDCFGCHSERGKGGFTFDENLGVPGTVTAQNITSDVETGIGGWTDGEIIRAVREGVNNRGKAIFPMMPYELYHEMADEDVRAIVTYLRRLPAISHANPPRRIRFPVSLFVKLVPRPVSDALPPRDDGKYLATIGGCVECHSPHDEHNQRIAGADFLGGWTMKAPQGTFVTPSLRAFVAATPRDAFITRFKTASKDSVMSWTAYAGMTERDLGAIYDYLRSLPRDAELARP